jgi:hypothetical protein
MAGQTCCRESIEIRVAPAELMNERTDDECTVDTATGDYDIAPGIERPGDGTARLGSHVRTYGCGHAHRKCRDLLLRSRLDVLAVRREQGHGLGFQWGMINFLPGDLFKLALATALLPVLRGACKR